MHWKKKSNIKQNTTIVDRKKEKNKIRAEIMHIITPEDLELGTTNGRDTWHLLLWLWAISFNMFSSYIRLHADFIFLYN